MKVLIIGASGLVGSNMLTYFKLNNVPTLGSHFSNETPDTVLLNTLQPSDEELQRFFEFAPDYVVHCGALTHVDYCEEHEEESYLKTVQSTINISKWAKQAAAKLVYISTDYVFNGNTGIYKETDKVDPINIYGEHKLQAEQVVEQSGLDYLIVRVAKVFGHDQRQSNFIARLANTIEQSNTLTWKAFTDQYTTVIDAWDISKAVYLLTTAGKHGIYHLSYGQSFTPYDLVSKVQAMYADAEFHVDKITTKDFPQTAERPKHGGLSNEKFLSEFPNFTFKTIEDYLEERKSRL